MLTEQAHALVDQFAKALELVGVAIILGGIFLATVTFLREGQWAWAGLNIFLNAGVCLVGAVLGALAATALGGQ